MERRLGAWDVILMDNFKSFCFPTLPQTAFKTQRNACQGVLRAAYPERPEPACLHCSCVLRQRRHCDVHTEQREQAMEHS